jgi:hypothetical protein
MKPDQIPDEIVEMVALAMAREHRNRWRLASMTDDKIRQTSTYKNECIPTTRAALADAWPEIAAAVLTQTAQDASKKWVGEWLLVRAERARKDTP